VGSGRGGNKRDQQLCRADTHFEEGKMVTLPSSCSMGSSYLNKVELRNGCLSLGHPNSFIPSALNGSVYKPETGALDMEKVKSNWLQIFI